IHPGESQRGTPVNIRSRVLTGATAATLLFGSLATSVAPVAAAISHHPRVAAGAIRSAGWASSNWSGYAKTGTYTKVTAAWVVPSVAKSRKASYSSQWVGIDGFNNSNLIQTGTEADYYNGSGPYRGLVESPPA